MTDLQYRDRYIRMLPGRIRIEFIGLLHSKQTAQVLIQAFSSMKGVTKAEPCSTTGRILIVFDETIVSSRAILLQLEQLEQQQTSTSPVGTDELRTSSNDLPPAIVHALEGDSAIMEAAVAVEEAAEDRGKLRQTEPVTSAPLTDLPVSLREIPKGVTPRSASPPRVPLPLAVAMGGLVVLGVKQLIFGRSALARSPAPFYLSGLVSVVTGYPFFRRGFGRMTTENKLNPDLFLGAAALGLAFVRENLVVLGAISILQYVNWKRSQAHLTDSAAEALPAEIVNYSEKAAKWGLFAAGATSLITRDPLRGIAVLLAANPRPATLPGRTAWQQAELTTRAAQADLPSQGSLSQLVRTKTILLHDTSAFVRSDLQELECVSHEDDPDKVICIAASLVEKSSHPWKDAIVAKAKQSCRTMRRAFHMEEQPGGIQGTIHTTTYHIGNLAYSRSHTVPFESYYLEAKRMESKGYDVLFVAKETSQGMQCLGILCHAQQEDKERTELLTRLRNQQFKLAVLHNSGSASHHQLEQLGMDTTWLDLHESEAIERIAVWHQQGEDVLLVTDADADSDSSIRYMLDAGVPSVTFNRLETVLKTRSSAKKIEATVQEHFQLTKRWNMVGSVLAAFGTLSAPIVNLIADAMSLLFLSRSQRIAQAAFPRSTLPKTAAHLEVASAAEAAAWHGMPWERASQDLGVDHLKGLTSAQATEIRSRFGLNELEKKKSEPWLVAYLGQFKEFTTLVLLGTSVLALFTGGIFDGLAMGAVLLANAAIGTMQERKAEKVVDSLTQFQPPQNLVIRDGKESILSAEELVPGDVVILEPGDRVPADIRLIRSWNLETNESALTGESVPVPKQEAPVLSDCPLSERSNMLYMGTDVTRGKALGLVVQTGMNTEIGHLTALLKTKGKTTTPLQDKVTSISKTFVKFALIAGIIVFAAGLIRGVPLTQMITTSITLAASAIPEGLPVTITIALSAGIFRMAKKNALIRKLSALETLGRTTIICSDKTGTLTKNEMTVKEIRANTHAWHVTGNGYDPDGAIVGASGAAAGFQPELERILLISSLCNNSKVEQKDNQWTIQGDPTEGALQVMAYKGGIYPDRMTGWHRGAEVPFDSGKGKMSVVCRDTASGNACYVFSKGSVEAILRHSSRYQKEGQVYPLTDDLRAHIAKQTDALAADALRVLGFAYRPLSSEENVEQMGLDERDMIFVGMAGMIDPPKTGVEQSILEAKALGVKPVMITGDHPITAIAIARQLRICDDTSAVLSGHELERMTDEELDQIVERITVFARMTPDHKLRIVKVLQRKGHIVTMTGDGVNDTPAIKQANVGIAMGRTGTEVSKGIADMVLKEDHFGSIVDGVKEGRTIISNIRKALGCLLTGNLAEILVTSAAVIAGMPIPLVPIQILLMNLLTDALPAMILAVNPGNKTKQTERIDIVDKELYQKVITKGLLLGVGSLGLFAFSLAAGQPVQVAQSIAFATLVAGQLIQTFSWRQEGTDETVRDWGKDRFLLGALGISWVALMAVLYVPPLARIFHTAPIALHHWGPILAVAASISWVSKPILRALAPSGRAVPSAAPAYAAA
ncbi:HAD-IC family P-type ATPase [Paenibacillus cremeus]|uniref:HAD-IC family P-type ATPase n=1 Tax=Paenibacillus cremeus TaxID=2163881 RepID=A0A559KE74_9BACL|nr:HAD-IC family P-type ATPase [Paenibacillus cremeus]TVY10430.1 HAD-IC family P-type ATPase [Paenibacillus cremeus]